MTSSKDLTNRRAFIATAGTILKVGALGAGGVTALAACSPAGGAASPSSGTSANGTTSSGPTTSGTATSSAPGATSASSAASRNAPSLRGIRVPASSVPVGGGTILADANFVVTQPQAGTYKAFTKICTHQECPVSKITGTNIVCECHGSQFSIADGSVTQGPADKPLAESQVTVSGSDVVIQA